MRGTITTSRDVSQISYRHCVHVLVNLSANLTTELVLGCLLSHGIIMVTNTNDLADIQDNYLEYHGLLCEKSLQGNIMLKHHDAKLGLIPPGWALTHSHVTREHKKIKKVPNRRFKY